VSNPALFVCTSCGAKIASPNDREDAQTAGAVLWQQLQAWMEASDANLDLSVRSVGCLWTCDRPCSVTLTSPGKYTYHFVDLDPAAHLEDLQQFSQLYLASADGYVKPPKMPGTLRSQLLVRVPPTD
jgi:predicted metal-binding protein